LGIFKRNTDGSKLCQLNASEVKIFLIFCYLLTFLVALWTTSSLDISNHENTSVHIGTYVQCLAGGVRDGLGCDVYRREFEALSYPGLLITYLILFAFLNISNLPLVIQYKTVKRVIVSKLSCLHLSESGQTTSSVPTKSSN